MANAAIVIARTDQMLMRLARGAHVVPSRHCSGVSSARHIASISRADIARSKGAIPSFRDDAGQAGA